jgi:outer membrane protein TolC
LRHFRLHIATPWLLVAAVAVVAGGCHVTSPDVPEDIARATGIENALVFRHQPDPVDTPFTSGTLTPDLAVRLALAHDPRIQADLARVRAAEAEANQSRLLPNPILNVDVRAPYVSGSNTVFEATLSGDLVSLLQKPGQIAAADKRLRASAATALATALDVMCEVQQAYVAAQTADAEIANAQKRAEILRQLRDLAKKRLDAGEVSRLDILTLDAQIMQANLELSDLRLTRFEDRLKLAKLIGQPRSPAEWPVEAWVSPPAGDPAPEAAWIDAALKTRPEIHSKLWELRALGDDLTAAEFSPFVGGEVGTHFEHDPEWRTGPTITVPLPIFDFGQENRAKLQATRLAARHELAGLQADVIQDVRLAYATFRSTRETLLDARDKLLPLQQQQLDLARLAYQTGESDLGTLLLAETDLQMTRLKIVELEEKVTVARVKLQRAAGGAAVAEGLAANSPATTPAAPETHTAPTSQPATGTAQ